MQLSLLDSLAATPDAAFASAQTVDLGAGAWVEYVPGWLSGHAQLFERLLRTADWERHRRQMYDRVVDVPRLVAKLPGERPGLSWNHEETVELIRHRAPSREVRAVGDALRLMAVNLSHRYSRTLTNITLAYYRDGNDSVSYHGDKLGHLRADTVVAIVSVGEKRRFLLRPSAARPLSQIELPGLSSTATSLSPTASRTLSANQNGADRKRQERLDAARAAHARSQLTRTFTLGEGDLLVMGGNCQETWEHAVPKVKDAGPRIAIMFREQVPNPLAARPSYRPPQPGPQSRPQRGPVLEHGPVLERGPVLEPGPVQPRPGVSPAGPSRPPLART